MLYSIKIFHSKNLLRKGIVIAFPEYLFQPHVLSKRYQKSTFMAGISQLYKTLLNYVSFVDFRDLAFWWLITPSTLRNMNYHLTWKNLKNLPENALLLPQLLSSCLPPAPDSHWCDPSGRGQDNSHDWLDSWTSLRNWMVSP